MLKAKSIVSILFLIASFYYEAQSYKQVPEWSKDAVMYELNVRQFSSEVLLRLYTMNCPDSKKWVLILFGLCQFIP